MWWGYILYHIISKEWRNRGNSVYWCFGFHVNIHASIFRRCQAYLALHAAAGALSCQAFSSTPVVESLWDRKEVAMTTMFVLWLVGRLLQQQQPQRAVNTVEEGTPPLSLPQGCLSSAQKVPRNDVTGEKRGSRGKRRRRRREKPKISSTSLSLRTAWRDQASASLSTQTDFPMRSDAPHPTR